MSTKRANRRRIILASAAGMALIIGVGSYTMASAARPWHDRGDRGQWQRPGHSSTPTATTTTPAAEPTESTDPAEPTDPAESADPTETTEPATPADESAAPANSPADITLPPANGQFDYQIGGAYTPQSSVQIVDRDREASPVAGKYNICYVNAFQTQPSDASFWTGKHDNLLLKDSGGEYVVDSEWDEYILDTSTKAKREALIAIVGEWVDGCAADGFDAVEPDNLDTYTRSDDLLSKADNVPFSALLAERAHRHQVD